MATNKLETLYRRLFDGLGPQGWWPLSWRAGQRGFDARGYHPDIGDFPLGERDRFEISLGAILTQNTAWANVEKAIAGLYGIGVMNAKALVACPEEELKTAIKPCGYYNQKAKKLRIAFSFLSGARLGRGSPPKREELLSLWGIGPETADSILLYAYGFPIFVIDAYTRRLLSRLGVIDGTASYSALQEAISSGLPLDSRLFGEYHALIVKLCATFCRKVPLCGACPLGRACRHRKAVRARP